MDSRLLYYSIQSQTLARLNPSWLIATAWWLLNIVAELQLSVFATQSSVIPGQESIFG